MKRRIVLLAGWTAIGAAAASDGVLGVEASEPRAYGYHVGDVVRRHVSVNAPDAWRLVEDSLPRPGARGQPLELRNVRVTTRSVAGGRRHELELEYQVFLAPPAVRTLEIAPWRLRFDGAQRSEEVRVDAWPVTVAPLAPVDVSPRRGLGELQPDRAPLPIDTGATRLRIGVCAAAAALLFVWVGAATFGPPWRAARQRAFGRAWRQLRRLPASPAPEQWRGALRTLHDALNRSAGAVLFEPGLDEFIAARPAFRALRDDLARFMQLSRAEFFGEPARGGSDPAWLLELCRRCRDAERGIA
jgi:mxaA protein